MPRIFKRCLKAYINELNESKPESKYECQLCLGILGNLEILEILNEEEIGRVGLENMLNWQLESKIHTFRWNFWRAKSFCEIWIEKNCLPAKSTRKSINLCHSSEWKNKNKKYSPIECLSRICSQAGLGS